MSIKLDKYMPLYAYLSPASIPQIVAHIQDYLVKHPILSVETIAEIIVQSLQEHPELINGEAIPISADSEQSIKAYIDALPALDTYTKAQINALLTGKQDTLTFDQAPTPGSSNPVTSSGIIAAMSALQSALETQISAKADRASTYTKTQVDTLLEDKADAADVYSKNTMDAKLLEVNTDIDNLEDALGNQSQQIDELGPNNTLTSDSTTAALSAVQGKALKGLIDNLGPINNLTSDSTTAALSAAQGKALNQTVTNLANKTAVNLDTCATLADVFTTLKTQPNKTGYGAVGQGNSNAFKTLVGEVPNYYVTCMVHIMASTDINDVAICIATVSLEGGQNMWIKYMSRSNQGYTQTTWQTLAVQQ